MKRFTIAAITVALAACGQPGADNNAAGNDSTHAAAGHEKPMNHTGPFAKSEEAMHRTMMAAVGVDVSDTWVRKMIAHHQGAIDMSREVLALQPTPDVRALAGTIIAAQSKENEQLRAMIKTGDPDPASAKLYEAADMQMMKGMEAITEADPSRSWIAKMIEHHRGAIAMSDVALANQPSAEVARLAEKTKVDQGREIAELERMLKAR